MTTTSTIILLFLIALIGFNIWNAVTLKRLINRPLRNDQLNDKNYWELKYKMQYMVTVFSVLIAIAAYLGYNTIDNAKESVRMEFQSKLDSTQTNMALIDSQIKKSKLFFDSKIANTDSLLNTYQNMLLGLSNRTETVKKSISISDKELNDFKGRIAEINSKNIIQQNIYIVDNISYSPTEVDQDTYTKKVFFTSLTTISGDKLPVFKKPPFILVVSNDGADYLVTKVTSTSFELQPFSYPGDAKILKATLFITENP